MRRLVLREHGRFRRGESRGGGEAIEPVLYDRLRDADCRRREEEDRVFAWKDGHAQARQWVGVMQVPGLQVEILPKTDALSKSEDDDEATRGEARGRLIYLLGLAGQVPLRQRDPAHLATRKAPLMEALIRLFVERLHEELLRGPHRGYQEREENLRCFKGRLLVSPQLRHNAAHRARFFCRYEDFDADTLISRILRSSVRRLLPMAPADQQNRLHHCLSLLEDVQDQEVQPADFARVTQNRQTERFADLLQFSRLLHAGQAPTGRAGETSMFSVLFDMNKVFECFVAAFLRRYVADDDLAIHTRGDARQRTLLEKDGEPVMKLQPDLVIERGAQRVIVDTKWKRPGTGKRGGTTSADLYQLYAYTHRFESERSILLFPSTPDARDHDFDIVGGHDNTPTGRRLLVRHINLQADLFQEAERQVLAEKLGEIIRGSLDPG